MISELIKNNWLLIGTVSGFGVFLFSTLTMKGIYFRPDTQGKQVFNLESLKEYLKAPLDIGTNKFRTVWGILPGVTTWDRIKMLQLNWVATTLFGIGSFYIIRSIL